METQVSSQKAMSNHVARWKPHHLSVAMETDQPYSVFQIYLLPVLCCSPRGKTQELQDKNQIYSRMFYCLKNYLTIEMYQFHKKHVNVKLFKVDD